MHKEGILLILAGGQGKRIAHLTNGTAKQFFCFADHSSMIQNTISRLQTLRLPLGVVVNKDHIDALVQLLDARQFTWILAENESRNTAAAIAFSVQELEKQLPQETVVAFLPADQLFVPQTPFCESLSAAVLLAKQMEKLVLLGCKHAQPSTQLGYFRLGQESDVVQNFVEKPSAEQLEQLLTENYFANCGIFIAQLRVFKQLLQQFVPELLQSQDAKSQQPNLSFDQAVLQRGAPALAVVGNFSFTDLGSATNFLTFKQRCQDVV